MTYDYTAFDDDFHWLPEENPANIIDICSDDDNDKKTPALSYPRAVYEIAKGNHATRAEK